MSYKTSSQVIHDDATLFVIAIVHTASGADKVNVGDSHTPLKKSSKVQLLNCC